MKQIIRASSTTQAVNNWLVDTHQPRILHIFEPVCNFINEHGEVLSIVTPKIGNGPFNLVVEDGVLLSDYLSLQSAISISSNQLHLGDLTIQTAGARIWNPCPDWNRLHAMKEGILNHLMEFRKTDWRPVLPESLISNLKMFIINADTSSALTIIPQLAGLGNGLTPAGDDFIMGTLYAAWIIYSPEVASVLAKSIAETAAPLTTSISAAYLISAGNGEAPVLWHELFEALITGDDLGSPFNKLLAVGESSGYDALSGFFCVMSAFKEFIIDECPF